MSTNVTWNGTTYPIPAAGETNWSALSTFLIDVGTNAAIAKQMVQAIRVATTSPVSVSATTDCTVVTNLGTPGAVAVNLPAGATGQTFLILDGKGDANTNNITITPNGAETVNGAATLVLNHARQGVMLQFVSGDWKVLLNVLPSGTFIDADIASGAAIARAKIASGNNYRILANNSTGVMSENAALSANLPVISDANGQLTTETYLDRTRGGTGITSTATFPSSGTIATIAGSQVITNKDIDGGTASDSLRITLPKNSTANLAGLTRKEGTLLFDSTTKQLKVDNGSTLDTMASSAAATSSVAGIVTTFVPAVMSNMKEINNADYTILDNDGYAFVYSSTTLTGNKVVTLPTAADNDGRQIFIKKADSGAYTITVKGEAAGETIDGTSGTTGIILQGQYDYLNLICDGAVWHVIDSRQTYRATVAATGGGTNATAAIRVSKHGPQVNVWIDWYSGITSGWTDTMTVSAALPAWSRPDGSTVFTHSMSASSLIVYESSCETDGTIYIFRRKFVYSGSMFVADNFTTGLHVFTSVSYTI